MIKVTIAQVKASIRKTGKWEGALLGNKSNPRSLWFNCQPQIIESLEDLEKTINNIMYYMPRELGTRVAFYQV